MAETAPPIPCRWDGESFTPASRHWARTADKHFVVGMVYVIAEQPERSSASHRHLFAMLNEAWKNLPETIADQYPSVDHLRKRALIEGGFYDETITDAGSNAAAIRVAAAFRTIDDFAMVFVCGAFVMRRTAKSQSLRAMGKEQFQRSKDSILEIAASLIGTSPDALSKHAGEAA